MGSSIGWLYGVYKPTATLGTYAWDPLSERVAPDDYKLEDGDVVIWKLGMICDYEDLFDEEIVWPLPDDGAEAAIEKEPGAEHAITK
jgi:hypothetical protein